MMMTTTKKLKIVPEREDWQDTVKEALKKDQWNTDRNSWWFLHGELENKVGYDKAVVINLSEFPELQGDTIWWGMIEDDEAHVKKIKTKKEMKATGIFPVEIKGIKESCTGFFWVTEDRECTAYPDIGVPTKFKHWCQRGLVVLNSDQHAYKDAEKKYRSRTSSL